MKQNSMVDNLPLPEELVEMIFMKVPPRDLTTCVWVCKSWSSIIKNPSFQNRLKLTKEPLFLLGLRSWQRTQAWQRTQSCEVYDLHYDNEGLDKYKHLHFPLRSSIEKFCIVGSVNGVVCLVGNCSLNFDSCFLWNPTTERVITLPKPINSCLGGVDIESIFFGFGYDSTADDYKVVRTVRHPSIDRSTTLVELFSLNTGSWKNMGQINPPEHYNRSCLQAFANGMVHWIAFNKGNELDYNYNKVLGFNVHDETLNEIALPDSLVGVKPTTLVLLEHLGSSIAVFHSNSNMYSLWVLKHHNDVRLWMKLSVVTEADYPIPHLPSAIRCNQEILLYLQTRNLISFELKSGKSKVLINFEEDLSLVSVHHFVESLALLGKGRYIPQPQPNICRICKLSQKKKKKQ